MEASHESAELPPTYRWPGPGSVHEALRGVFVLFFFAFFVGGFGISTFVLDWAMLKLGVLWSPKYMLRLMGD